MKILSQHTDATVLNAFNLEALDEKGFIDLMNSRMMQQLFSQKRWQVKRKTNELYNRFFEIQSSNPSTTVTLLKIVDTEIYNKTKTEKDDN